MPDTPGTPDTTGSFAGSPTTRRAVVFGMDGVRFDVLRRARTPHLDAIAADVSSPRSRWIPAGRPSPAPSGRRWPPESSRRCTASSTTTCTATSWRPIRPSWPGSKHARPGARTFALADWPPLVTTDHGGPIFPGGRLIPPGGTEHHGLATWEQCEDQLADDAVEVLGRQDVHAAFVYFVGPDAVAHELGTGPEYVHAIEATDARMGRILAAIRARATAATEEWTVVVVTDHGHRDEGGHGGDSPEERTAWIAASGPTVPATPPEGLAHADIHPHVLTALGIDLDPSWGLTGRPFDVDVQPA